jgi:hypothetical protein
MKVNFHDLKEGKIYKNFYIRNSPLIFKFIKFIDQETGTFIVLYCRNNDYYSDKMQYTHPMSMSSLFASYIYMR